MSTDAMTRTFGVALSAIRPGPPYGGAWRTIGRQPIGRLEIARMLTGQPSPVLSWAGVPERIVVQGIVLLDPTGEAIYQFGFSHTQSVDPGIVLTCTCL